MRNFSLEKWKMPSPPDKYTGDREIDLLANPVDYDAVLLISAGMSQKTAARQTGLTKGQVAYRLKLANKNRKKHERFSAANYRDGISPAARVIITTAIGQCAKVLNPELRRTLSQASVTGA